MNKNGGAVLTDRQAYDSVALAIPTDVDLASAYVDAQWYIQDPGEGTDAKASVDVRDVWSQVSGKGVRIGVIDDGFDVDHPDLAGRFDLAASYDPRDAAGSDIHPETRALSHGTFVAGIIGAAGLDGSGTTGIAYDATLVGYVTRFGVSASARGELVDLLSRQASVDVSNNSWGVTTSFLDNFQSASWAPVGSALEDAATAGRGGLGTVFVFAAGNDREYVAGDPTKDGDNTNYHGFSNNRHVVTVGSVAADGTASAFSTPGASVFVAAPGEGIFTTRLDDGDGQRGNDYIPFSGTSAAAPIVSGIVALMLEANPRLGYRDIQDILAASSNRAALTATDAFVNKASVWNGGGYAVSDRVGFGLIDAHAAVRMAESWTTRQTAANETVLEQAGELPANLSLDAPVAIVFDVSEANPLALQWAEVDIDIAHGHVGDLVVKLISPGGTVSTLVDRPGAGSNARDNLVFTLTSNQFWGERIDGEWKLIISDEGAGGVGGVVSASLRLTGTQTADDVFAFTDDFAAMGSDPVSIGDPDGGDDTINASAIRSGSTIDLAAGSSSTIAGRALTIANGSIIENAIGGDGADTLLGNERSNRLSGWRGDDVLSGRAGDDQIDGGAGVDTAVFSGKRGDYAILFTSATGAYTIRDLRPNGDGVDTLVDIEKLRFADADVLVDASIVTAPEIPATTPKAPDSVPEPEPDPVVESPNHGDDVFQASSESGSWIDGGDGNDLIKGGVGDDILVGGAGNDALSGNGGADMALGGDGDDAISGGEGSDLWLDGGAGDDTVSGGAGDDLIGGGDGRDTLDGGDGQDLIVGGAGDDEISGGSGNDIWIAGEEGNDVVRGDNGDDLISGGSGSDHLFGGAGVDAIWGDDGDDFIFGDDGDDVWLSGGGGKDAIVGGGGNDILIGGGDDDHLIGGDGYDLFVFYDDAFGKDVIEDFRAGAAHDILVVAKSLASSFETLGELMTQAVDGVRIDFGADRSIFLKGLTIGDLSQDDVWLF